MRLTSTNVLLPAATLLALAGCRIEKPATVVPKPPTIVSFSASTRDANKGDQVTLSWKVTDATRIELRESSTGPLNVAENTFEGTTSVTVDADALYVLTARGAGGSDARAVSVTVAEAGGAVTFQALPPSIPGGADATLVWSAPGARAVTLSDGTAMLDVGGQLTAGAVTVKPEFNTTYTLTVDGTAHTVAVDVQPALLTLAANPPVVQPGATITLEWTAMGADSVEVSADGRPTLATITDRAKVRAGTFTETAPNLAPGSFLHYVVTAKRGTASMQKSLDVFVGSNLAISRFDAPPVAAANAPYSVRWQTVAADAVELYVDGALVHRTASPLQAATGQYTFTAPARDFTVELVASDARGGSERKTAQVDAVGVPTTLTLTASAATVAAGTPVTLTWSCPEARFIRIVDGEGLALFSATGQRAESGTLTVSPATTTTFSAKADNQLGSAPVTASTTVTVTGSGGLSLDVLPRTAVTGQLVQVKPSSPGAVMTGLGHSQVLTGARADFLDISSTGTRVLETGGNVVSVDLPFTTVLWGVVQSGPLTISRAGWVAWNGPLVVNSSEVALPSTSTSAAPFLIAPYWDDLTLTANSAVFVQVLGDAPDQQLVVQWNKMQCGTTTNTDATFQVRVHQTGKVSFHYKTMTLNSGPSFSIGSQNGDKNIAVRVTTTPVTDSALYLFSPVTLADVRVQKGTVIGGYISQGGVTTRVSARPSVVAFSTDLAMTEFMFRPAAAVSRGQYVELVNLTSAPLDLTGWAIRNTVNGTAYPFPDGTLLQPNVYTVLGQSTDAVENDDAGVGTAWSPLTFEPDAGNITFTNPDAAVAFTYSGPADGGRGTSVELQPGRFLTPTGIGLTTCAPTLTYGAQTPAQLGSPGAAPRCFPYTSATIPSRFVDISADGGTPLLNSTTAVDGTVVPVWLADAGSQPVPVAFGVPQPYVSVSTDGWMQWGITTTSNFSNDTTSLSSGTPQGTLAIFWDDLQTVTGLTPASDLYWKYFAPNEDPLTPESHWVFQWKSVRHYGTSPVDNLNFEVMLFETGVIEYHYGAMTSGTTSLYANGNSASVFLENPAGTAALTQSLNQPTVQPNSAIRFTPVP